MRKSLFCMVTWILVYLSSNLQANTLLTDDFSGNIVDQNKWHIPTWVSSNDGTYVGRTQFRCTQNSPLPACEENNALITVETYNPTGQSFYGTDLISNQTIVLGEGVHIKVRAKMNTSMRGIVGGIFLYALKSGSNTLHDEIDFELLTNQPHVVQTNVYSSEPLGVGHPQFVPYISGSITDYHTYEIKWLPDQVSWFIDGNLVRTETNHVPTGPMSFHLNIWVPDSNWTEAYDADLQYTLDQNLNQVFSMSVDSVSIQSIFPGDVNGDNTLGLIDAILALQVLVGFEPANIHRTSDVNWDNKIGIAEVSYILQKISGVR